MKYKREAGIQAMLRQAVEKKRWNRKVGVLCIAAVITTAAALSMPAITMQKEPICGMQEHIHGEKCYNAEGTLICTLPEHTHTDACWQPEENASVKDCGMEEHTHGDGCYDAEGNLICTLPEHVHGPDCGNVEKVLICTQEHHTHTAECWKPVMIPVCGLEEHTHGDGCYDAEGNLICTLEEHTHEEGCYGPKKVLICQQEEHAHGEECYETRTTTVCQQEEHTHEDSCYETKTTMVCGKEEHTHGDGCYDAEGNLICEKEEHTHGEECSKTEKILTCGKAEHTHGEGCHKTEKVLICDKTEHTHGEECYQVEMELVCGKPVHNHTEQCYAYRKIEKPQQETGETQASSETSSSQSGQTENTTRPGETTEETVAPTQQGEDSTLPGESAAETVPAVQQTVPQQTDPKLWEEKLAAVKLTGDWGRDLAAVAASQDGYQPQDGEKDRFGGKFPQFCLNYVGIFREKLVQRDTAAQWAQDLKDRKLLDQKTIPTAGDLTFLDDNQDGIPDSAAIVLKVRVEDTPVSFTAVRETENHEILSDKYKLGEDRILGICSMDRAREDYLLRSIPDTASFTFEDENMKVTVDITGLTVPIPKGTRLVVARLSETQAWEAVGVNADHLQEEKKNNIGLFDMRLMDGENRVLLNPEANVQVKVQFRQPLFPQSQLGEETALKTLVFDAPTAEPVKKDAPAGEMTERTTETPTQGTTEGTTEAPTQGTTEGTTEAPTQGTTEETTEAPTQGTTEGTTEAPTQGTTEGTTEAPTQGTTEDAAEAPTQGTTAAAQTGDVPADRVPSSPSAFSRRRSSPSGETSVPEPTGDSSSQPETTAETAPDPTSPQETSQPGPERTGTDGQGADSSPLTEVEGIYGGVDQGLTELTYTSHGLSPFAVVLAAAPKPAPAYWQRVSDPASIQSGDRLMILTVDGNYALVADSNNYVTGDLGITLNPVKGNPGYFTAAESSQSYDLLDAIWEYKSNTSGSFLQMIRNGKRHSLYAGTDSLAISRQYKHVITFQADGTDGWSGIQVDIGGYGLYYNDSGKTPNFISSDKYWSQLLVLKAYEGELTVPNDIGAGYNPNGQLPPGKKPDYSTRYIDPSGADPAQFHMTDPGNSQQTLTVHAVSDPPTSKLETQLGHHPVGKKQTDYDAQKVDNGMIVTDKSVVYQKDNYGAFAQNTYTDGVFGVTMSALGQFADVKQEKIPIPMDVLYILDLSGSMNDPIKGDKETSRASALVTAMNSSIQQVMDANPENRVAVAGYHSISDNLMPLGRYKPDESKEYLHLGREKSKFGDSIDSVEVVAKTLDGTSVKRVVKCDGGTYTQSGIARGAGMLLANTDTSIRYHEGKPDERVFQRKPVVILISDGEPTHCTPYYDDVLNNPFYGDGYSSSTNAKGIMGYYTILSANSYKYRIGNHYRNPASMYTITLGIDETNVDSKDTASGLYKATVLDPDAGKIQKLADVKRPEIEGMLYSLLKGTGTDGKGDTSPQQSGNKSYILGPPHNPIPVITDDPYRNSPAGYDYADGSYQGDSGTTGLQDALNEIITQNDISVIVTYPTENNTPVTLRDPIGEGMELKSAPVLRVGGKSYLPRPNTPPKAGTTTYVYDYVVAMDDGINAQMDLSTGVKVSVVTDAQGKQVITMEIAPSCLPVYTADPTATFLMESRPIRLSYQVGLSEQGMQTIKDMAPGETKAFYTNRYQGDVASANVHATGDNPYFQTHNGTELDIAKASNPTQTNGNARKNSKNGNVVTQQLDNNGRLTVKKPSQLSIEKKWLKEDGETPMGADEILYKSVTALVSREYQENGSWVEDASFKDQEFLLESDKGWKTTISAAQLNETEGQIYRYTVKEGMATDMSGKHIDLQGEFLITITGDQVASSTPGSPVLITNQRNPGGPELPDAGSVGTTVFYLAGMMLVLASGAMLVKKKAFHVS